VLEFCEGCCLFFIVINTAHDVPVKTYTAIQTWYREFNNPEINSLYIVLNSYEMENLYNAFSEFTAEFHLSRERQLS